MICRPTVAMRDLVAANLRLQARRDGAADFRDHDEAAAGRYLGAAQRLIGRDDPIHGVADVFDISECTAMFDQVAFVMVIEGMWRKNIHATSHDFSQTQCYLC